MEYEIEVQGKLDASWSEWLEGLRPRVDEDDPRGSITTLTGPILDQSALRGILNRLWDLNLELVSVRRRE